MQQVCQQRADLCKYSKVHDMAQEYGAPQPMRNYLKPAERTKVFPTSIFSYCPSRPLDFKL